MRGIAKMSVRLTFTFVCLLQWPLRVHLQSLPDSVNGDSSTYQNNLQFRPPYPPQSTSFNPISAILGNLFGGFSSFSMPPSPLAPPGQQAPFPGPPRGPFGNDAFRDQTECREAPYRPNGFPPGHPSGSFKSMPDYTNSIDSSNPLPPNRTGVCVSSPQECKGRQGNILGPCFGMRGPGFHRMAMSTCCNFDATCNQVISTNGSHFTSPKFPNPYSDPGSCSVTIKNTYNNICQIRLDFDAFNLKQPFNGNCNTDRFIVSGQPNNVVVPSICGYNPGQHMYIDVDEKDRDSFRQPAPPTLLTINVITTGIRHRWFDIRVSYIPCDSDFRAPTNCLQYFTSMVGQVKSFNYDMFNQGFTYFNNLDYTMCFKKWPGFCTVTFEVPSNDEWGDSDNGNDGDFNLPDDSLDYDHQMRKAPPIQVTTSASNSSKNKKKIKQNLLRPTGETTSFHIVSREYGAQSQSNAAAGPLKCNSDYLSINNVRFCGYHLNEAALYSSSIRVDSPVMDNSTGPLYARFVTSGDGVGKGFLLNYQLNACLMNG